MIKKALQIFGKMILIVIINVICLGLLTHMLPPVHETVVLMLLAILGVTVFLYMVASLIWPKKGALFFKITLLFNLLLSIFSLASNVG